MLRDAIAGAGADRLGLLVHFGDLLFQNRDALVEDRDALTCAISGYVRGDIRVLELLNRAGQQLALILDNGIPLPILLTEKRRDGLTWEFISPAASPLEFVSPPPLRL